MTIEFWALFNAPDDVISPPAAINAMIKKAFTAYRADMGIMGFLIGA